MLILDRAWSTRGKELANAYRSTDICIIIGNSIHFRYYGWYNLSGDLDAACYGLNQELDFWEKQNKPVMITEYGADAVAGIHECVPEMFSEEFQVEFYKRQNAEFDRRKFFIGEHVWNFADFATVQGCMRVDGNKKGLSRPLGFAVIPESL